MIYGIGSRDLTGPVEINADTLTDEENRLLHELFRLGLGYPPNEFCYKGTISISYDFNRTKTMKEETELAEARLEDCIKENSTKGNVIE